MIRERWDMLTELLDRIDRRGFRDLEIDEAKMLCRLYRQVTIDLSRARAAGDQQLAQYLNLLTARAHGRVYAVERKRNRLGPIGVILAFPRAVARRWRAAAAAVAVFIVVSIASFVAVLNKPALAYSLFDERIVEFENIRLEKQQGEYRGNFTFSVSESPLVAAEIIGNNIRVAIASFAFGAAMCLPGVLILAYQGRMLGTLSGLIWNGGYFVSFYGLILTHGVIELSALCLASAGGFVLGAAIIAPGRLPRGDAVRLAARDAFTIMLGVIGMLIVAGVIEAYVTPHASAPVRWWTAGVTGVVLLAYLALGWVLPAEATDGATH